MDNDANRPAQPDGVKTNGPAVVVIGALAATPAAASDSSKRFGFSASSSTRNTTSSSSVKRHLPSPASLFLGGARQFHVAVLPLDDARTINGIFKRGALGQSVFDFVCDRLDIEEREYFGLRYQDADKHRYWLDLQKPLSKTFSSENVTLRFRVRFYPEDPLRLREEITRYRVFAQLQRDLIHGRLNCGGKEQGATLAALILQSIVGDYDEAVHGAGSDYVSQYSLLLKQTASIEDRIAERHKAFKGMRPSEAELEFLRMTCRLETYGFDPYVIKDAARMDDVAFGTNCQGVLVFAGEQTSHPSAIEWKHLEKVDYSGKHLYVYPNAAYYDEQPAANGALVQPAAHLAANGGGATPTSTRAGALADGDVDSARKSHSTPGTTTKSAEKTPKKHPKLTFICPSGDYAKHLWRHLLAQQAFYTADHAATVKMLFSRPRIPLFARGSTFRLPTARVQKELIVTTPLSSERIAVQKKLERAPLQRVPPRSLAEPWNREGHANAIHVEGDRRPPSVKEVLSADAHGTRDLAPLETPTGGNGVRHRSVAGSTATANSVAGRTATATAAVNGSAPALLQPNGPAIATAVAASNADGALRQRRADSALRYQYLLFAVLVLIPAATALLWWLTDRK